MLQVTNLMDHDVVDKVRGQEHEPVVEVEIPLGRAAPPARAAVADRDTLKTHLVELGKMGEPSVYERPRSFFMSLI
jgi:hypothetical protein